MAKASLASTELVPLSAALAPLFELPPVPMEEKEGGPPYVVFASTKSLKWPTLAVQIPGLQEGDVILVRSSPELPIKLNPFKFFFLAGKQYWATLTPEFRLLRTTYEPQSRKSPFKETVESLILVHAPEGLVAATCRFGSTKSSAGRTANAALAQAASPEWGKISEAHKESLRFPHPFMRFTVQVSTKQRTSRETGYPYHAAEAAVHPSGADEVKLLKDYFSTQDNADALGAVKEAYDIRLAEIESKLQK